MGVVFVRGIVEIDDFRLAAGENGRKVSSHPGMSRLLHVGAGMRELDLYRILAQVSRLPLFFAAHGLHLLIGEVFELPDTGGTAAISNDHAAKGLSGLVKTVGDPRVCHNLNIVLMRTDAKMGDATKCIHRRQFS